MRLLDVSFTRKMICKLREIALYSDNVALRNEAADIIIAIYEGDTLTDKYISRLLLNKLIP